MEEYFPSEIARLVLGYLKEVNCSESWKTFLAENSDLAEFNRWHQLGKTHTTNVDGKSLLEILREYCNYKRGASKNVNLNQSNGINSDSEVFRTPGKGNQQCSIKYRIYQKSRTQQVSASPRCDQSGNRLARTVNSASFSPSSVPSPKTPRPSSSVLATALNFGKNAQSASNNGNSNESEAFSSDRRSYSLSISPAKNSDPHFSRTAYSDPIGRSQSKRNKKVQTDIFSHEDSSQNASAQIQSVQTKQLSVACDSHNSSLHEIPSENISSHCDPLNLPSNSHSKENTSVEACSSLESSEKTNQVVLLENVAQNSQSFVLNESIIYQASEITSTNKNITITTLESSLTPQNLSEPPAYYRAPSTNSPRLFLSDERSRVASLTTPQKQRSFEEFYAASPRRKGFIPRRRLLSGSPLPKQVQNDPAPPMNIYCEELTFFQDFPFAEEFAHAVADEINKAKCSEAQLKEAEDLKSSYSNIQISEESEEIIKNVIGDPTRMEALLDKFMASYNKTTDGCPMTDSNDTNLKISDNSEEKKRNLDSEEKVVNETTNDVNQDVIKHKQYDNLNLPQIPPSDFLSTNASVLNSANNEETNQNLISVNRVTPSPCSNASKNEGETFDSSSALCETYKNSELNSELHVNSTNVQIETEDNEENREESSAKEMNSENLKQVDVTHNIEHQNSAVDQNKADLCYSSNTSGFDKDKFDKFFDNMEKDLSMNVDRNSTEIQNHSLACNSLNTKMLVNTVPTSNNETSHNQSIILPNSNQITLNTPFSAGNNALIMNNGNTSNVNLVAQPAPNILQTPSLLPTQTILLPPVPIESFQNSLQYQIYFPPGITFQQVAAPPLCGVQSVSQNCSSTLNSAIIDKTNLESVANYVTISPEKVDKKIEKPSKPALKSTQKKKKSNRSRKKAQPRKAESRKTQPVTENVSRNLRSRKKKDYSDLFSSSSPAKPTKQKETNETIENKIDYQPVVRLSIPESKYYKEPEFTLIPESLPSDGFGNPKNPKDSPCALEIFSSVTGRNEKQTPQFKKKQTPHLNEKQNLQFNEKQTPQLRTLLSSAGALVRKGDRLKSPSYARNLNFELSNTTPDTSPTQRRSSSRVRTTTTCCSSCEISPSKNNKMSESNKACSPKHKIKKPLAKMPSDAETQNNSDPESLCTKTIPSDEAVQTIEMPLEKSIEEKIMFVNTSKEATSIELAVDSPNNIDPLSMSSLSKNVEAVGKAFGKISSSPQAKNPLNDKNEKHLNTPSVKYLDRTSYFPSSGSESETEQDAKHNFPCSIQSSPVAVMNISIGEEVVDTAEDEVIEQSLGQQSEVITENESVIPSEERHSIDISLHAEENSKLSLCQQEVLQKEDKQEKTDSVDFECKANTSVVEQEKEGSLATVRENFDDNSSLEQTLVSNDAKSKSANSMQQAVLETSALSESSVEKIFDKDKPSSLEKGSDNISLSNVSISQTNENEKTGCESKMENKICIISKASKLKTPDKSSGEMLHNIVDNIVSKKRTEIDLVTQNNSKSAASQATSRKSYPPKKRIRPIQISSPNDRTYNSNSPFFPAESRCPKEFDLSSADMRNVTETDAAAHIIPIENSLSESILKAKSPDKVCFNPLSEKQESCPTDIDLSSSSDTQKLTVKECTVNVIPIEKQTTIQSKIPQTHIFHSTPLSGKPKAMAEFYLKVSKKQNSALPISPGSISSSSCTIDTFIARQQALHENNFSFETGVESPIKNQCDSEQPKNTVRKRKLSDEPDSSVLNLTCQSSPQSKTVSCETEVNSCSPVMSMKRKCQAILYSSPEESSQHASSENVQKPTIFIDDSAHLQNPSLDQVSPVKSFPGNKQTNKSHLSKKTELNPHIPAGVKIPSNWKHSNISNYSADILKFSKQSEKPEHTSAKLSRLKVASLKPIKKDVQQKDIAETNKISGKDSTSDKNNVDNNAMADEKETSPKSCSSSEFPTVEKMIAEIKSSIKCRMKNLKSLKKCTSSEKDNGFTPDKIALSHETLSIHSLLKNKNIEASKINVLKKYNQKSSPKKIWMPCNKQKKMNKKSLRNKTGTCKSSESNVLKHKKQILNVSTHNRLKYSDTTLVQRKKSSTPKKCKTTPITYNSPKSNDFTLGKNTVLDLCSPGSRKIDKMSNHMSFEETNRNDSMKKNESANSTENPNEINEVPNCTDISEPNKEVTIMKHIVQGPVENTQILDNGPNIHVSRNLEKNFNLKKVVNYNSSPVKPVVVINVSDEEVPEEKQSVLNNSMRRKKERRRVKEMISCSPNFTLKRPIKTYSLLDECNFNKDAQGNPPRGSHEDLSCNKKSALNLSENNQQKTDRLEKCNVSEILSNQSPEKKSSLIYSLQENKKLLDDFKESYTTFPLEKEKMSKVAKSKEIIHKIISKHKNVESSDKYDANISVEKTSVTDNSKLQHQNIDKAVKVSSLNKCEKTYPLKRSTTSKHSASANRRINKKMKFNATEKHDVDSSVRKPLEHAVRGKPQTNKECLNNSRDSEKDSSFKKQSVLNYSISEMKKLYRTPGFSDPTESIKTAEKPPNSASFNACKLTKASKSNNSKDFSRGSLHKRNSVACPSVPNKIKADEVKINVVTVENEQDFSLQKSAPKTSSLLEQPKTITLSNADAGKNSGQEKQNNSSIFFTNQKKEDNMTKLGASLKPHETSELTRKIVSDHSVSKEAAEYLVRMSQADLNVKDSENASNFYEEDDQELFDTQPLERTEEDENEIAQAIAFLRNSQKENCLGTPCKSNDFDSSGKKGNVSKLDESLHQCETEELNATKTVQINPETNIYSKDILNKEPRTETHSKSKEGTPSGTSSTKPNDNEYNSRKSGIGNSDVISEAIKSNDESSANEGEDKKLQLLLEKINKFGLDNLLNMVKSLEQFHKDKPA